MERLWLFQIVVAWYGVYVSSGAYAYISCAVSASRAECNFAAPKTVVRSLMSPYHRQFLPPPPLLSPGAVRRHRYATVY